MKSLPLVTVIMPIRNEGAFISRSLTAVLSQAYPKNLLEVLVVDGMSTDGTREIVKSFQKEPPKITLIDNPEKIVPTGMNRALALARGEVIIRVDGHAIIAPDYIHHCVQVLLQGKTECVGGPMETICETREAAAIALAMSSPFGVGGVAFRTGVQKQRYVDTVAFGAYTREAIERAGLFDEELVRNQDDEYNYRVRKQGGRILLTPEVRSRYYSRSSLRTLWRQYFQYGYWKVRVLQKHPRQMSLRQFAPPAFVLSLLGGLLLSPFTLSGRLAFLLIGGAYLLSLMMATIITLQKSEKRDYRTTVFLPLCFLILHIAYGAGFVVGLIKFWNRWGEQKPIAPFPTAQLP